MPQRNGFHARNGAAGGGGGGAGAAHGATAAAPPPVATVPSHVLLAGAFVKALIRVCGKLLLRDMNAAAETLCVTSEQEGALAEALEASAVPTEAQFGGLFGALGNAGLADEKVAVLNGVAEQFADRNKGTTIFANACNLDWAIKQRLDTLAPSELFLTRAFLRLMKRKIAAASSAHPEQQEQHQPAARRRRHRAVGRRRKKKG